MYFRLGLRKLVSMYIPPVYKNTNAEQVRTFIRENAFGILVSAEKEGAAPLATHLPLELEKESGPEMYLYGHFARANPHWKNLIDGQEVLCIFNGPHSYVSSSWYQDEEVPTWNYISVQVHGVYEQLDEEALLASLHRMVDKYEKGSAEPVSLHDMSEKTMRQIRGIVGFRIRITQIEAAYKLSQGREADHPRIVEELNKGGANSKAVARAMGKKNLD